MKVKKNIVIIPLIILFTNLLSFNVFAADYSVVDSGWKGIYSTSAAVTSEDVKVSTDHDDMYWFLRKPTSKVVLKFYGTKLRLIGSKNTPWSTDNKITISNSDGVVVDTTFSTQGTYNKYCLLYEITDLALDNYTVTITPGTDGTTNQFYLLRFDIDDTGHPGYYELPLDTNELLEKNNQYLCYISIINSIILFSFCIFKWLRPFFKELK